MIQLFTRGWKRAFDYKGKSSRVELASFVIPNIAILLFLYIASIALLLFAQALTFEAVYTTTLLTLAGSLLSVAAFFYTAASAIPTLALIVRRTRDMGLPVWTMLAFAVPVVNIIALAAWLSLPSNQAT